MPPKSASKAAASPSKSGTPSSSRPKSGKRDAASKPGTAAAAGGGKEEEMARKLEALQQEKQQEEQTRNLLQLERDKIASFWELTRHELDDRRAELRVKDRDIEELQDRHAVELKVCRQKVKHLLYEQQSHISKLKADAEVALRQQADVFARQEAELGEDKRRLKQHIKEQELSSVELLKQFRLENAQQMGKLRQEFELQARQIQQKYEAQLKELQEALEARYTSELREVEERKNAHIQNLMASHEKSFREMKSYYNEITHANLDLIKTLKEEIADMKRTEAKQEKLMNDVARENKRLTEPLSKAVQEVETLRQAVASAEHDKASLASAKARLATAEKQLRALEWENEVLAQRLEVVQRERDELQGRFDAAVLAVQQRASLRAVVLEKKLEALGGELDRRDAELSSAMSLGPLPSSQRASLRGSSASPGQHCPLAPGMPAAAPTTATQAQAQAPSAGEQASNAAPNQPLADPSPPLATGSSLGSLLATALSTPLPDADADILEDEAPAAILSQLEEMQAKEALAAVKDPALAGVTGLEAKLAQAVAAAEGAVASAMQGGMIPAVRSRAGM